MRQGVEPGGKLPACRGCGSTSLRRSLPRTFTERLLRSCTPFHLYFCRQCEHRGWHFGALPNEPTRPARPPPRRGRPFVTTLLVATALGLAAGFYAHGCQQREERGAGGTSLTE